MAITPTVLMAANELMKGSGLGVSGSMTSLFSQVQSNPLVSGIGSLGQYTTGANAIPGLSDTLNSLPSFMANASSTMSSIQSQASAMIPSGVDGMKSFAGLLGGASSFGSASAEWSAAITQFSGKSFGDLGVGMKGFGDVVSGGVTGITSGFSALASQAKSAAFGAVGANLDPAALAKGQAAFASNAIGDGLKSVGSGLKNFGSLFDFKNPLTLGPANLISQLQQQGLADRTGINDKIAAAGYDPKNLSVVPESVLKDALAGVQGDDLQKVLNQTGAKPVMPVASLADVLNVNKLLPASAVTALGLAKAGPAALAGLGNTFTNLGVQVDNFKMGDFMGGLQTKASSYLDNVKSLVPADIKTALAPMLGTGSGLFGNPTMMDMIGSAAGGPHIDSFKNISGALGSIQNSPAGQALNTAIANLNTAAASGDPAAISAAKTALDSTVSGLNSNADFAKLSSSANSAMQSSMDHLSKETSNLALAGINLSSMSVAPGITPVLSMATKLHSFGVDKQQLGFSNLFEGMAGDNLGGDAIKSALLEGRNTARMIALGKPNPAMADEKKMISEASAAQLPDLQTGYDSAKSEMDAAKAKFEEASRRIANDRGAAGIDLTALQADYLAKQDAVSKAETALNGAKTAAG